MSPSVDSTHRGEWFALLFHVTSVMITFHVIVEIQLKELHEWYIAYLQLRTSVVYLCKTNEPLKWWLLFFCQTTDFLFKIFDEIGIPGRADSFEFEVVDIWNHVCELRSEGRSLQFYTQVLQLRKESLKNKKTWIFFRLSFPNCKSCLHDCDDLPSCSFEFIACSRESELALARARSMWPIDYR